MKVKMHHRDLDLEFEGGEYVTLIPLKPDIITGAYKEYYILKEEELQERDERIARHWYKMGVNNGHGSNTFEDFFEDYKKNKGEK